MTSIPMWNRGYAGLMYRETENIKLGETQRPFWSQGIWEMLEKDDYEIIEESFDTITALALASGKYGILCPEQEGLSNMYVKLPQHIKEYGYSAAIALDAINTYTQSDDAGMLSKGIEELINILKHPVYVSDLPRNHRLDTQLYKLFSENGEVPQFFVVLALVAYQYFTSFDYSREEQNIRDNIDKYISVYSVVFSS